MPNARAVRGGLEIYTEDTENEKSPTISASRDGTRHITRTLVLHDPTHVDTLMAELFPPFAPPGQHPSGLLFFASNVQISPIGAARDGYAMDGQTNLGYALHDKYRANVTYKGLMYDHQPTKNEQPNPEQNLTVDIDCSGQYQIVPSGSLYWADGKRIDNSIVAGLTLVSDTKFTLTKHNAQYGSIPFAKAEEIKGRVNAVAYPANHFAFPSCPVETLLFVGMQVNYQIDTAGNRRYQYTLQFWKQTRFNRGQTDLGWNHFYDPSTEQYRKVYTRRTGNPPNAGVDPPYRTFTNADLLTLLGA